jgi:polyribonucleotide 5'-hydroxyl-kinase
VVRSPIGTSSPANPLGSAATSAPTALASNALIPLTYWYGHPDTKSNPHLLDRLIRNLGVNVLERHDADPQGSHSLSSLPFQLNLACIARVSGLIVDTPSSFASGPSSGSSADSRHTLIKACVDAFHSMYTSWSLPSSSCDIISSKRHPRRRSRKAQRRDAASLWQSTHGR